ncbi:MAG: glycosyltransferase [Candidatus Babeliales bacterium]
MKSTFIWVIVCTAIGAGAYYGGAHYGSGNCISSERCTLRTGMRKLWSDHVWWTRDYIIAAVADAPDLKAATDRLLKNQEDIGSAVASYYGKEAGEKLTALLKEHILIAAEVVSAAKANDSGSLKTADEKWHVNADAIALFLSKANPHWSNSEMQDMMYKHLKLTTEETVARLKKDWVGDVQTFDKVFDEIMMMADMLTAGIAQQFPEKF